ncbi:MAG: membrane protein insertion efficiency factor YidD [Candidatus Gracilibacteria bacterium]
MKGFFPYGFCKFEPSCSQYMKERLLADGVVIGLTKGTWQILRCNPWNKGNRMKGGAWEYKIILCGITSAKDTFRKGHAYAA